MAEGIRETIQAAAAEATRGVIPEGVAPLSPGADIRALIPEEGTRGATPEEGIRVEEGTRDGEGAVVNFFRCYSLACSLPCLHLHIAPHGRMAGGDIVT